jgi:hypothetical protein
VPLRLNQADLRLPAAAWAGACAPHPTQGAAMALEDSVVLAEMLTSPSACVRGVGRKAAGVGHVVVHPAEVASLCATPVHATRGSAGGCRRS